MSITLRPYQAEAVGATIEAFYGPRGLDAVAGILPTGAGKTVVFSGVGDYWLKNQGAGKRMLVIAHRTELIEQAAGKLRSILRGVPVGVVAAGRNETLARVVVGSVQTLASERRRAMIRDVGLLVVDECHHAAAPTYRKIFAHYGVGQAGGAKALGVTATLSRGDGKALGDVWQDVVFEEPISDMVAGGWLIRPRGIRVWVEDFDLSRVRQSGGDYSGGDLGRAIEDSSLPEAVAKAITEHALTLPTIVFGPTVASCRLILEACVDAGFSAALVWGEMAASDRAVALQAFRDRKVQILVNCMVLTEGTDLPLAACAVIARPTRHPGLYIQMVGRIMRPEVGKTGALVIDMVGASQQHSLTAHAELFGEPLDPDELIGPDGLTETERTEGELAADALDAEIDGAVGLDDVLPARAGVGNLLAEEVNLFHQSRAAWLRTPGGLWFLPTGSRYIVVHPGKAGGWDISSVELWTGAGSARYIDEAIPDLGYARAFGEEAMTKAERKVIAREADWRLRSPTLKTKEAARLWGVPVDRGMSEGELHERIAVAQATARLDVRR